MPLLKGSCLDPTGSSWRSRILCLELAMKILIIQSNMLGNMDRLPQERIKSSTGQTRGCLTVTYVSLSSSSDLRDFTLVLLFRMSSPCRLIRKRDMRQPLFSPSTWSPYLTS